MACVMVVDNDDGFRVDLCDKLTRAGYFVVAAANGLEAVSPLQRHQPDVVISEVVMPEMDGFELIQHIKRESLTPWIIAVHDGSKDTGYPYLKMAEACGADFTVAKPCDTDALVAMVTDLVKRLPKRSSS